MNTEYEDNIICPYCGCEFSDSWEYNYAGGKKIVCENCEKDFYLNIDVSVSYSTLKIKCEEKNEKCKFELDKMIYNPYIYNNKNWTIWKCKKCENEKILTGEVAADGLPYVINLEETK